MRLLCSAAVAIKVKDLPTDVMFQIASLRCLPVSERVVEGKHSLVKRGLRGGKKTARSATTVSLMSGRHKEFLRKAEQDVSIFTEVATHVETLRNGRRKIAILHLHEHPAVKQLEHLEAVVGTSKHIQATLYDKVARDIFYRLHHSDQQGDVCTEARAMVEGVLSDKRVRAKLQRQLIGVKELVGKSLCGPDDNGDSFQTRERLEGTLKSSSG